MKPLFSDLISLARMYSISSCSFRMRSFITSLLPLNPSLSIWDLIHLSLIKIGTKVPGFCLKNQDDKYVNGYLCVLYINFKFSKESN